MTNELRALLVRLKTEISRFSDNEHSTGCLGECVKLLDAIARSSEPVKPPVELVREGKSRFALLSVNPTKWQSSDVSHEVRIMGNELHLVHADDAPENRLAIVAGIDCWLSAPTVDHETEVRIAGRQKITDIAEQVLRIELQVAKHFDSADSRVRSTARTTLQDQKARWLEAFEQARKDCESEGRRDWMQSLPAKLRPAQPKKRLRK